MPSKLPSKTPGYLCVFAAATLWGVAGSLAKFFFNRAVDPLVVVEFRLTFGALVAGLFLLVYDRRLLVVRPKDLPYLAILGVFGLTGAQATCYFTISQTTVATAIFLQFLAPVPIAIYSSLVRREPLGPAVRNAAFVAVLGSGLLLLGRQGRLVITPAGLATGLLSAFFLCFHTLWGKRRAGVIHPWTTLFYSLVFGAIGFSMVRSPLTAFRSGLGGAEWAYLAYTVVFSTVIPHGLYFMGLRVLSATETSIVSTLEPVIASLAAFIALGETLTVVQVLGAVLISASIIYIQSAPASAGRAARAAGAG
ncbi:MAG TPA: DMT family transporter [Bacillota bacterium]